MGEARISRGRLLRTSAAVAAGGVLAACGPIRPAAPGGQAARSRAPAAVQIWENARFRWREDVGKEITDPLLAANPWLTLDTTVPAGDAREKFVAASAAGAPPDAYSANSTHVQTDFVDGLVLSLESYINGSKVVKKTDVWASLRLDVEFRGHMTAWPYAPDTRIVFTHEENARRAGLDPNRPPVGNVPSSSNCPSGCKSSGSRWLVQRSAATVQRRSR